MFNVNITPNPKTEEEFTVIMSILYKEIGELNTDLDFIVKPIHRTTINVGNWGEIGRYERFKNKF